MRRFYFRELRAPSASRVALVDGWSAPKAVSRIANAGVRPRAPGRLAVKILFSCRLGFRSRRGSTSKVAPHESRAPARRPGPAVQLLAYRLLRNCREYRVPVSFHIHHNPVSRFGFFQRLVEHAEGRMSVIRIFAVRVGVVHEQH